MKKNLVLGAVFAAALFAVSPAKAIDSTGGCGLGSMAWRGQSGIIPQVLAMTTQRHFSEYHRRYARNFRLRSERARYRRYGQAGSGRD